ncbi:MAG: ABC transporter permease [Euryarchaeota archaeon]|nr:ABC transporter permease [Euryarchaeota archaeon]
MVYKKETVIGPRHSPWDINLRDIWDYRELLYFLTLRQIKTKYKQTAIGVVWVVLQPLLTMAIFALIFYRVGNFDTGGIEVYPFLFSTLMLWTFFSSALNSGSLSLVSNANMISKIYFPRFLLPLSLAIAGLLDYFISWGVFVFIMIGTGETFSSWMVFIWVPLLLSFLLVNGLTFLFSAMAARYRDVQYIVPFFTTLLLFASPILYPLNAAQDPRLRAIMTLNPLAGIMDAQRFFVFGKPALDMTVFTSSIIVTILVFMFGLLYFKRYERQLADVI